MSAQSVPGPPGSAESLLCQRHNGQRVLLVEDNLVNQEVAAELLRAAGLEVEIAANGALAVEMVLSRAYDLVLMDIQMPVMDGVAATRAIRQRAGFRIPIIAVTALAFPEERASFLDAGMNDHVVKPVDPEVLYAKLLRWLPTASLPDETVPATLDALAAAPCRTLEERLAEVEGFDYAQVLRNVGSRLPVLERVLESFARNYRHGEGALAADDVGHWHAACHSLRGASATIGATALLRSLEVFEQALHAGAEVPELTRQARQLDQQLRTLAAQLKAALAA